MNQANSKQVTIFEETTKKPITLIGKMAGICYGSDTKDDVKNYRRGLNCIKDGHGRVLEYPQIYMKLEQVSCRFAREFYTAIGGMPTRLQESTRYVNMKNFGYYLPSSIGKDDDAFAAYKGAMDETKKAYEYLIASGIPKEDAANLIPLGADTVLSVRGNARWLSDMAKQRLCSRALLEYRQIMREIIQELSDYSEEWKTLCGLIFKCKCDEAGYCLESKSCGRYPKKVLTE